MYEERVFATIAHGQRMIAARVIGGDLIDGQWLMREIEEQKRYGIWPPTKSSENWSSDEVEK